MVARRVRSLSARRAWIEMMAEAILNDAAAVALRKESVDRNTLTGCDDWLTGDVVALRKESVDRNASLAAQVLA